VDVGEKLEQDIATDSGIPVSIVLTILLKDLDKIITQTEKFA